MKELLIEAEALNLETVLDFVSGEVEAGACVGKAQTQIAIAVEEIFINIAHYAYQPVIGKVFIRVTVGDEIVIEFADRGVPYNPLNQPEPDTTKSAEEREIGGLGILMVKKIMDKVSYRYEGGHNILTISKSAG